MSSGGPDAIEVRSLDALRTARFAVAEYREVAARALGEAIADGERTVHYLTVELRGRWEQERRSKERMLNHLKSELARAELQAQGSMVSTREERAKVDHCKRAIEHANRKLAAIRGWTANLERELALFRGQLQGLSRLVDGDLKRGEAELVLAVERLETYLAPEHSRADPRAPEATPSADSGASPGPDEETAP